MKTNAKQIGAIATLAQPKPFDVIQQTYFLGVELIGFNTASDKIIDLQNQIEATKTEKGTRKKALDVILKDMQAHGVTMIESGKGKTKCPVRLELKRVLDASSLADGTKNNIITAVAFALKHKKPYDIKGPDKYNAAIKEAAEKEKLKNEILASATPNATPNATPKDSRKQYISDTRKILDTLVGATQVKRALQNSDKVYYDAILASVNDIYETLKLMTLDKDVSKVIDDIQDDDIFDDDDLQIDSELVD